MSQQSIWELVKKGNKSSLYAMIGNSILAIAKGVAFIFSGSGAMFASAMHSLADSVNQGFVFIGSVLSEKEPTEKFPTGFGRVINLFCMIAVIVVSIMAYETIKEGFHLINHPAEVKGIVLNLCILLLNIIIDGAILLKVMKEIGEESRDVRKGIGIIPGAFTNVTKASPPTRLVFYEDVVAVSGALLALVAVTVSYFTAFDLLDGVVTIIIGCLMIFVAFRVGYDNMIGLIGVAAPKDVEDKVANMILQHEMVVDIYKMRIIQEGRYYHVEAYLELKKGLQLSQADDIKFEIHDHLTSDPDISDATLGILEDDGAQKWENGEDPYSFR
ncbi:cation diffusion facilitator family transporter [Rossellomorea aquimaris]|uniref:cation diffusion facilitator family transporter n=1 Tax=Rossellomorea aquimaris TaxID=189382 RepID=UPI001CD782C5|nr:cation diffusion facilitator family transporter [Rossellomorea aquimaris]MCA1054458.1 cation diffusion facilitator family transporter [Rossellomorea aquimaris]